MPVRSKKICLLDYDKLSKVNSETLKLYKKYEVDMAIRELSKNLLQCITMTLLIGGCTFMTIRIIAQSKKLTKMTLLNLFTSVSRMVITQKE